MISLPNKFILSLFLLLLTSLSSQEGLVVFSWKEKVRGRDFINFGDKLAEVLVERIVGKKIAVNHKKRILNVKQLFAIGSVLSFAATNDVVWGAAINGRLLDKKYYFFSKLDVRALRGPLTRQYLIDNFGIVAPEIYGDPALLFPYLFPEFQKSSNPSNDYIIIPHYSEEYLFPKEEYPNAVYPTEPWDVVIQKILDSKFVISSSLHGLILAEAYGIPARQLYITDNEPLFKYQDYYLGSGRMNFQPAISIEDALKMGGEPPIQCDLQKLMDVFPFEFWEDQ